VADVNDQYWVTQALSVSRLLLMLSLSDSQADEADHRDALLVSGLPSTDTLIT
jgi:hypothetical protein